MLVPIWIVADRAAPLFEAAVNVTAPGPWTLEPAVIVIHDALVDALQMQVLPVVTVIAPLPPLAAIACAAGSSVKVHGAGDGDGAGFGAGTGCGVGTGDSDDSAG